MVRIFGVLLRAIGGGWLVVWVSSSLIGLLVTGSLTPGFGPNRFSLATYAFVYVFAGSVLCLCSGRIAKFAIK
jgi:hypothetical protein